MDAGVVILTTPERGHTWITVTPSGLLPDKALPLHLTQKISLMTTKLSAGLAGGKRPANTPLFPSSRRYHHSQDGGAEYACCAVLSGKPSELIQCIGTQLSRILSEIHAFASRVCVQSQGLFLFPEMDLDFSFS